MLSFLIRNHKVGGDNKNECPSSVCLSVRYIFVSALYLPLKRIFKKHGSMFWSVRWCAEGMSQPFWLKVTLEGQMFEPAFCFSSIPPHSLKNFHKTWIKCLAHWGNVLRAQVSHLARGQGHTKGHVWVCVLCLVHISQVHWRIFKKFGSNVQCTEMMCRRHELVLLI